MAVMTPHSKRPALLDFVSKVNTTTQTNQVLLAALTAGTRKFYVVHFIHVSANAAGYFILFTGSGGGASDTVWRADFPGAGNLQLDIPDPGLGFGDCAQMNYTQSANTNGMILVGYHIESW